jgi:peptide/nickel transport system substrate-binding protein
MVKIGEADMTPTISVEDATDPQMDRSYLNSETAFLRIDMSLPPLNDKRVRLALNYAVDRAAIRGSILPKDVLDATQMVMPSVSGHNPELDKMVRPYDPAKAKQLLAEAKAAGVPVDKELTLFGQQSSYPGSTEVMEAIMTMYKAVGLNVKFINLEPGQWTVYNRKPFAENRAPNLFQSIHDNNSGDAVFSVPNKYGCNASTSAMCDPALDDMVAALDEQIAKVSVMTGEERVRGWQQVFRVLYEDIVPEVWLYHLVGYARVGNRITYKANVDTGKEIHIQEIAFKQPPR